MLPNGLLRNALKKRPAPARPYGTMDRSYIRIPEHEDVILVVTVGELKRPFIGVIKISKISADLQVLSRNEETAEVGQIIIKSTEVEVTVVIRVVENHRSETCTNEEGKT